MLEVWRGASHTSIILTAGRPVAGRWQGCFMARVRNRGFDRDNARQAHRSYASRFEALLIGNVARRRRRKEMAITAMLSSVGYVAPSASPQHWLPSRSSAMRGLSGRPSKPLLSVYNRCRRRPSSPRGIFAIGQVRSRPPVCRPPGFSIQARQARSPAVMSSDKAPQPTTDGRPPGTRPGAQELGN